MSIFIYWRFLGKNFKLKSIINEIKRKKYMLKQFRIACRGNKDIWHPRDPRLQDNTPTCDLPLLSGPLGFYSCELLRIIVVFNLSWLCNAVGVMRMHSDFSASNKRFL